MMKRDFVKGNLIKIWAVAALIILLLLAAFSIANSASSVVTWTSKTDFTQNAVTTNEATTIKDLVVTEDGDVKLPVLNESSIGIDGALVVDGTNASGSTFNGQIIPGGPFNQSNPLELDTNLFMNVGRVGVQNRIWSFTNVTLQNGACLTHSYQAGGQTEVEGLELRLSGNLNIDATSKIDISGKGYRRKSAELFPIQGTPSWFSGPGSSSYVGGGGYGAIGGMGGTEANYGSIAYGTSTGVEYLGSGGGVYDKTTAPPDLDGNGGGRIKIIANNVNISGSIQANGLGGKAARTGGGSGGGILIYTNSMVFNGVLSAAGGGGAGADYPYTFGAGTDGLNGYGGHGGGSGGAVGGAAGVGGNGGAGASFGYSGQPGGASAGGGGTGWDGGGGGAAGRIAVYYGTFNGSDVNFGIEGYNRGPLGVMGPYAYFVKKPSGSTYQRQGDLGTWGSRPFEKRGLIYDAGSRNHKKWKRFVVDADNLSASRKVKWQFRSSSSKEQLNYQEYIGPDYTGDSWFDASTYNPADFNFKNASRFIEIRLRLESEGTSTPVLHSFSLEYDTLDDKTCSNCHNTRYPGDEFDKQSDKNDINTLACLSCHYFGEHNPGERGFTSSKVLTPFGSFDNHDVNDWNITYNATAFDDEETVNIIHSKHTSKDGGGCMNPGDSRRCHQTSVACDACHLNVSHANHGSSRFASSTVERDYLDANAVLQSSRQLQCTNEDCHSRGATIDLKPKCNDCHYLDNPNPSTIDNDGHGDVGAIENCVVCHGDDFKTLSKEPTDKEGSWWGYHPKKTGDDKNCWLCHNNEDANQQKRDRILNSIQQRKTSCSACHDDVPHNQPWHKFDFTLSEECKDCHGNSLEDAHINQATDAYTRTMSCYDSSQAGLGCHQFTKWKELSGQIDQNDKSKCTNCHTIDDDTHYAIHNTTTDSSCQPCHLDKNQQGEYETANLIKLHREKNLTCETCHSNQSDRVINAIKNHDKSCDACHDMHQTANDKHDNSVMTSSCQRCHGSSNLQQIHTDTEYAGLQTADCVECHLKADWPKPDTSGTNLDCARCHQTSQTGERTVSEDGHININLLHTYSDMISRTYSGIACLECHPTNNFSSPDLHQDCYVCHPDLSVRDEQDPTKPKITIAQRIIDVIAAGQAGGQTTCDQSSCHDPHPSDAGSLHEVSGLNALCINCHGQNMNNLVTYHGEFSVTCQNCHNYSGTKLNKDDIDFAIRTGNKSCNACHTNIDMDIGHPQVDAAHTYQAGVGQSCLDCHTYATGTSNINILNKFHIDTLKSTLGKDYSCFTCHNYNGSKLSKTRINQAIIDGNEACNACHDDLDMTSGHQNVEAKHPLDGGTACQNAGCHSTSYTNGIEFHGTAPAACARCHTSTDSKVQGAISASDFNCSACHTAHAGHDSSVPGLGSSCVRCHGSDKLPDIHQLDLQDWPNSQARLCDTCHSSNWPTSWEDSTNKQNCANCHTTSVSGHTGVTSKHTWSAMPASCIDANCHSGNELSSIHAEKGIDCYQCHASTNQTVRSAIANNQINCSACHPGADNGHSYSSLNSEHRVLSFGPDCQICHNNVLWKEHEYRFKGTDKGCRSCHKKSQSISGVRSVFGGSCFSSSCHNKQHNLDEIHLSNPQGDCQNCHVMKIQTEHKKRGKACIVCHRPTASSSLTSVSQVYSQQTVTAVEVKKDTNCFACHAKGHPFSNEDCKKCHGSQWKCSNCHKGYDKHKGNQVDCQSCHTNLFPVHHDKAVYEVANCIDCHKTVDHSPATDNKTCLNCHPGVQHYASLSFIPLLTRAGMGTWHPEIPDPSQLTEIGRNRNGSNSVEPNPNTGKYLALIKDPKIIALAILIIVIISGFISNSFFKRKMTIEK